MATEAQRDHLHELMHFLLQYEPQVHYAEVRPMRSVHFSEQQVETLLKNGHGITMDCSEGVTCLCKWAGLSDPNRRGYNGQGNTSTLRQSLPNYTNPKKARTGAIVVFGPGYGEHAAMVLDPDPVHGDPLLWSHGGEHGPIAIRLSVERQYHHAPVTFLSIANL